MPKKSNSKVPSTFIDATNNMSTEELRNEILKSTAAIDAIEEEREGNEKFQSLKEAYSEANGGYRDGINAEKAKIAYAKLVLKQRGQEVVGATTSPFAAAAKKA